MLLPHSIHICIYVIFPISCILLSFLIIAYIYSMQCNVNKNILTLLFIIKLKEREKKQVNDVNQYITCWYVWLWIYIHKHIFIYLFVGNPLFSSIHLSIIILFFFFCLNSYIYFVSTLLDLHRSLGKCIYINKIYMLMYLWADYSVRHCTCSIIQNWQLFWQKSQTAINECRIGIAAGQTFGSRHRVSTANN